MAEHANSTGDRSSSFTPSTAIQEARDAIANAAVVTDIIGRLASADISSTEHTCPTSYEWLARSLTACHDRVEMAVSYFDRRR